MSFEPAQVDRTESLRNLKDLASVMSSEQRAAYRNDTPLYIVEKPHLRINLPKEHGASLEAKRFDDTQAADRDGGVDRHEEGNGQIAHKGGFEFAGIGRDVGVFDINVSNQRAQARILHPREDVPALEKPLIALNGLLTVLGNMKHIARRH
ncbi:hypothetical protein GCM10011363_45340 [Marivita lacus]|uniref:Uncharacterized protein n=1 Tax=Marivita lacus TaxID=1323742 RepID=A0ABQ1LFS2_9RHOB|nr:hypothetical protein [Marivita lacus]GGC23733.1 hypothetical protein GCM10011363_45340 [Marivita lacus]